MCWGGKMVHPAQSTVIGTGILIQTARLIVDPCHRYPANVRELSRRNPRRLCVREQTPRPSSFIHTDFHSPFRFGFVGTACGLHTFARIVHVSRIFLTNQFPVSQNRSERFVNGFDVQGTCKNFITHDM